MKPLSLFVTANFKIILSKPSKIKNRLEFFSLRRLANAVRVRLVVELTHYSDLNRQGWVSGAQPIKTFRTGGTWGACWIERTGPTPLPLRYLSRYLLYFRFGNHKASPIFGAALGVVPALREKSVFFRNEETSQERENAWIRTIGI
jgi:hypothetical protein